MKLGCGQAQLVGTPPVKVPAESAPPRTLSEARIVVLEPSTIELEPVRVSQPRLPRSVPRNMTPVLMQLPCPQAGPVLLSAGGLAAVPSVGVQP